jgi:hypothetical protein
MKLLRKVIWPTLIVSMGIGSNTLVARLNGGMPAYKDYVSLNKATLDRLNLPYPKYSELYAGTQLPLLADILPFNLSIGDVLIYTGLVAYVVLVIIELTKKARDLFPRSLFS